MNNEIGTRVRQLRTAQKLTRRTLSERLGISESFMGLIERNERKPGSTTIAKLCEAFNVSCDFMVLGKDETGQKDINVILNRDLSEDEISFVMNVAKTVIFYRFSKDEHDLLLQEFNLHAKNISRIREPRRI
jgi:transcriptional regulator with XRE-family HTH domain